MTIYIIVIGPEIEYMLSSHHVATWNRGKGATAGFGLLKRRLKLSDTLAIQTLNHTALRPYPTSPLSLNKCCWGPGASRSRDGTSNFIRFLVFGHQLHLSVRTVR